jgi:outer membrane protein OmpA-like peptidoglycan-associated protein/ABC-type nitrate/sulfonate/bicarbonate transport system substrate-binding protein
MKIKIQPAGKAVISIIVIILLYFLLKITGVFNKLPSLSTKFDDKNQTSVVADKKKLDRPVKIGFSKQNLSPALYFANDGFDTGENSLLNKKFDLKAKLIENNSDNSLIDEFLKGGDNSGVDVMIIRLDQFLLNYSKIEPITPSVFLLTEKKDNRNFIMARSYIKTPRLLLGRKIAVRKNSSAYFYLLDFLSKNSITKNDVNIVLTEDDKEAYNKTISRFANVCVLSDINLYKEFKKNKEYVDLTQSASTPNPYIAVAQRTFITEHYSVFQRLTEAFLLSADSLAKDQSRSNEIISGYLKTGGQAEQSILSKFTSANYQDNFRFFNLDDMNSDAGLGKAMDRVKMVLNKSEIFKLELNPKEIQYIDILKELSAKFKIDYSGKEFQPPFKEPVNVTRQKEQIPVSNQKPENIAKTTIKDTIKKKQVKEILPESADKSKISLFFAPNDSKLDSVSKIRLQSFIKSLSQYNKCYFEIKGNTDSTGEDKYNYMLSKWRAESVAGFLKSGFNIPKEQMSLLGQGSKYPVGSNKEEKGKRKNRRVDILIKNK